MKTLYQSLVSVEPFTLVVTILNLFLQLYLIKRFLLDKVMAVLDQRQELADKQLRETETARQEAQQLRQSYEGQLTQVNQKADQILHAARKSAEEGAEQILRQAQEQATLLKEKASDDIAQAKKKALNDTKDEIADLAMEIAEKVVGRSLEQQDQNRLIEEFIGGLGDGI